MTTTAADPRGRHLRVIRLAFAGVAAVALFSVGPVLLAQSSPSQTGQRLVADDNDDQALQQELQAIQAMQQAQQQADQQNEMAQQQAQQAEQQGLQVEQQANNP